MVAKYSATAVASIRIFPDPAQWRSSPLPFELHQSSAIEVEGSATLGLLYVANPGRTIIGIAALQLNVSEDLHNSECATFWI
jgi:hypothetical protein